MEVYVIRHTKVDVNNEICYGQSDVPLSKSFKEEVKHFTNELPQNFDAIYCSPSNRCKTLAETLNVSNIIYKPSLIEMNFGEWEKTKWNDINQVQLHKWMKDFVNVKPPNGENLLEVYERVTSFLNKLREKPEEKVLLITHAGVIRCIWGYLLEIPLQNIFKIPVNYGEILIFNMSNDLKSDWIIQKQ